MESDCYIDVLNECSRKLIINDGLTLANLALDIKDGVFFTSIIPYLALYCRSTEEFFNVNLLSEDLDKEIVDMRNGLKMFTGSNSKSKKITLNSDRSQDEKFRNMIRFRFLKRFNIHYNLGIYFTEESKIIGNTQYLNYYLKMSNENHDPSSSYVYKLGVRLGKLLMQILIRFFGIDNPKIFNLELGPTPKHGYVDYNSNKMNNFFITPLDKENNLILLHLASTIGFINNYIIDLLDDRNLWAFRVVYITVHNVNLALKKFVSHIQQNKDIYMDLTEVIKVLSAGDEVISSDFRGCMMHYSFVNKNKIIVKEKYFDEGLPFFGLIESCFEGEDYFSFYTKLKSYSESLESLFYGFFNIESKEIQWD